MLEGAADSRELVIERSVCGARGGGAFYIRDSDLLRRKGIGGAVGGKILADALTALHDAWRRFAHLPVAPTVFVVGEIPLCVDKRIKVDRVLFVAAPASWADSDCISDLVPAPAKPINTCARHSAQDAHMLVAGLYLLVEIAWGDGDEIELRFHGDTVADLISGVKGLDRIHDLGYPWATYPLGVAVSRLDQSTLVTLFYRGGVQRRDAERDSRDLNACLAGAIPHKERRSSQSAHRQRVVDWVWRSANVCQDGRMRSGDHSIDHRGRFRVVRPRATGTCVLRLGESSTRFSSEIYGRTDNEDWNGLTPPSNAQAEANLTSPIRTSLLDPHQRAIGPHGGLWPFGPTGHGLGRVVSILVLVLDLVLDLDPYTYARAHEISPRVTLSRFAQSRSARYVALRDAISSPSPSGTPKPEKASCRSKLKACEVED